MNYYKILNENEKHHKMKYKTGLNKDIIKFNPKGSCEPGGLYFSREDIFAFLNYGPWIRKVTLEKDSKVYKNPGFGSVKWKTDKFILGERKKISTKVIKKLINEGANIKSNRYEVLHWASRYGYFKLVEYLIPLCKSKQALRCALDNAIAEKKTKVIKVILPFISERVCKSLINYYSWSEHKKLRKIIQSRLEK